MDKLLETKKLIALHRLNTAVDNLVKNGVLSLNQAEKVKCLNVQSVEKLCC